ncbi:hypothetical protein EZJ19_14310 [Parasulfuritortus cantonensis]|uniref:Lipoprotein n=1 Tax=Parasulfuritortus cantonensis TaxID=2528202 RepID=A0A4R1B5P0_9PROT|nr:hypothetical protein [Parasulfuritortus cantonensis]TCJ11827.1 hypothetical protein EZJ19_14310 [Parasulfuritortus cantonensis]
MPSQRTLLAAFVPAAVLAACAADTGRGPESPYYAYPAVGVRLLKPLTIPADQASVRLQNGHPVARNGVEETEPYCILEIATVAAAEQTVAAGDFPVARVQRRVESFSGMPVFGTSVFGTGTGHDDGPSQVYYVTQFTLHAPGRPEVRSLTCQHNQATAGVGIPHHLTLAQMRAALGDYILLDLPR